MKQISFNEKWLFWKDKNSFALVWNVPEHARTVSLPHDAMMEEIPDAESLNGGNTGFRDGANYVYYKTFTLTKEDIKKRMILKFEGSYMHTFVYVNGQLAGKHHYGYTVFYVPIHEFLMEGENEVRIQVRNGAMSNSRWYSGGGIYRDLYLLTSNLLHISKEGCKVMTTEITDSLALIDLLIPIENEQPFPEQFSLKLIIRDMDKKPVQFEERSYFIKAGEKKEFTISLPVDNPELWSAETPYLYTVETALFVSGEEVDSELRTFGIRTVTADSKRGLCINGNSVKLRGACIHHDSGLIGAETYETSHRRQIRILKKAGFNAIRMAHHPSAPALLKVCDELGMYVMEEAFDMWTRFKGDFDYSLVFDEAWKSDVTAMVESAYNHPSVILYSIGNEIPEIGTWHGSHLAQTIHASIKSIDRSRPTLAGINGVFAAGDYVSRIAADVAEQNKAEGIESLGNVNDFMSMMETCMDKIVIHPLIGERLDMATAVTDIAGYNYMTARYEPDTIAHPNRIIVGSETYPPDIARNWELVKKLSNVIGDFTWTGWDYIGEAGVGIPAYHPGEGGFGAKYPCQLAYCGDIDITGFRRPLSYYREIVFGKRKEPYIAVQHPEHYGKPVIKTPWVLSDAIHSWNWSGYEGKPAKIEVYAIGEEVALFLNGKLIEKKVPGDKIAFLAEFETFYQPGELKAVNYQNGKVIGESVLETADESTIHLSATVEKNRDLTFIEFTLEDSFGRRITDKDQKLELEMENVELLGFGTGNPKPEYHYRSLSTVTFEGRAMAIVRVRNDNAFMKVIGESLQLDLRI